MYSKPLCVPLKASHFVPSVLYAAISDRQLALLVTLVVEIPILYIIIGGSGALCGIVGQRRYQMILGFLPLICAVSGNAALQSREVTLRAISNKNEDEALGYNWFVEEATASTFNGIIMGLAMGSVAYFVSDLDITFGVTILAVQLFSILSASLTGTFVSLLCGPTLKRQWSLQLVSACQDIVGSFATIVLSYYIVTLLPSKDVDPGDSCIVNVNP